MQAWSDMIVMNKKEKIELAVSDCVWTRSQNECKDKWNIKRKPRGEKDLEGEDDYHNRKHTWNNRCIDDVTEIDNDTGESAGDLRRVAVT